jgi:hypothetical protein
LMWWSVNRVERQLESPLFCPALFRKGEVKG